MEIRTNKHEKRAIKELKKVAKSWPDSIWLFSGSGALCVMKKGSDGQRVMLRGKDSGVDQGYMVDRIDIENDGGDW